MALKGLGGFQLLVDATNGDAVDRLRQRKQRPGKPLAVMLASLDEVRRRCEVSDEGGRVLLGRAKRRSCCLRRRTRRGSRSDDVADGVAPGNPYLGVMLPYTPLHHLLLDAVGRPIVCTSGNLSEEPMAITAEDALQRLGAIADLCADARSADRPAGRRFGRPPRRRRRCRCFAGPGAMPRCRSTLGSTEPTILAVGGHLKNTVALSLGRRWSSARTSATWTTSLSVEVHRRGRRDLVDFFQVTPEVVACDLHPDYASTRHAEALGRRVGRAAGARAASPRPRGRLHGRDIPGRARAGVLLGRHRLRHRRHGLGRRGAGVRRGRASRARGPPAARSPCPAAIGRSRAAALGAGAAVRDSRQSRAPSMVLERTNRLPRGLVHRRRIGRTLFSLLRRGRSSSRGPAAWAGCSTRWPRCAASPA